jgi:hypothetical protein
MQPIFDNQLIKSSLKQGIQGANDAIELAVAWFTDTDLFAELVSACARGVKVCVLLNDDETNRTSRINWDSLVENGGALYWYTPQTGLMHHKFCVIDGAVSYFGTYNWTFSAASFNNESIIILPGQPTANSFRTELKVLLENPNTSPHTGSSAYFIGSGLIGHPEIELLRTEISFFEVVLAEVEEKIVRQESRLIHYDAILQKELAELLLENLRLKELLASEKAKLNKKRVYEEEAERWRNEYKKTSDSIEKANTNKPQLEERAREEMGKMYKQAIRLIHPDRFSNDPDKHTIATQITQELIAAYKAGDIKRVEEIWHNIQNGLIFISDLLKSDDVEVLRSYLHKLKSRYEELSKKLEELTRNETLVAAEQYPDFSEYVEICRQQLIRDIEILKKEIKNIQNE